MRQQFVEESQIQHVIDEINKLYEYMFKNTKIDPSEIKSFMEACFIEAGYRDELIPEKISNKTKYSKSVKRSVKNILIIHDAGTGDFILMSAVIREIRRIYPKARIALMINRFAYDLAFCCPYVDEIVSCKDEVLIKVNDFFDYFKKISNIVEPLLKYKIDVAFNFGHYPSSQLIAYMSGAKERVDLNFMGNSDEELKLGNIPNNIFADFTTFRINWNDFKKSHYNDRFLYILQKYSKNQITDHSLEIWLSPADRFAAEERFQSVGNRKLYAVVPGGNLKLACKRWPAQNYAELMNMILEEESVIFAIFGGVEDVECAKVIETLVPSENIFDFTGKLNYRQSAAYLSLCDLYIGNDTGLMHAASAFKIPVLSPNCFPADVKMTVSSLPALYYPYDVPSVIVQPKHALDECISSEMAIGCKRKEPHCINQISPEIMFEGLKILQKKILSKARDLTFYNNYK